MTAGLPPLPIGSPGDAGDPPDGSGAPLDVFGAIVALRRADQVHARLEAELEEARRARVAAVAGAVAAGATLRRVGLALGVSHVRVLRLLADARGEAAPRPVRRRGAPISSGSPGDAGDSTPCLREGCPHAALAGRRFCGAHQWS